jgi:hypothetical protein
MDRNKVSDDRKHIFDKNFTMKTKTGDTRKMTTYLNIEGKRLLMKKRPYVK